MRVGGLTVEGLVSRGVSETDWSRVFVDDLLRVFVPSVRGFGALEGCGSSAAKASSSATWLRNVFWAKRIFRVAAVLPLET